MVQLYPEKKKAFKLLSHFWWILFRPCDFQGKGRHFWQFWDFTVEWMTYRDAFWPNWSWYSTISLFSLVNNTSINKYTHFISARSAWKYLKLETKPPWSHHRKGKETLTLSPFGPAGPVIPPGPTRPWRMKTHSKHQLQEDWKLLGGDGGPRNSKSTSLSCTEKDLLAYVSMKLFSFRNQWGKWWTWIYPTTWWTAR